MLCRGIVYTAIRDSTSCGYYEVMLYFGMGVFLAGKRFFSFPDTVMT